MIIMNDIAQFDDHPSVGANKDAYIDGILDLTKALPSWRQSLLAHKWLTADGAAKPSETLGAEQKAKYDEYESALQNGVPLPKPIIGIGMVDNIEVGSGAAVVLLMAHKGAGTLPVHIRAAQSKKLMKFMA